MAKHLVQRGHQVSLMLIADHRKVGIVESEWDGVHIIETPDLLWGRLRSGWDLWDLVNRIMYLARDKNPYDIIHCFETRPATIYPALNYLKHHKIPLVTDWIDWFGRGGLIKILRPKWYQFLFGPLETYYEEAFRRRADGLTVISTALANRAIDLGVSKEKICYIPGGTFPELFQYRTLEECRQKIGISPVIPVIGFCSDSFIDTELVFGALANVVKKYPSVKLLVTGSPGKNILDQALKFGVVDNLYLTGYVPFEELPWYLGCADLFILPFPNEVYNLGRWPNKMGDYLSLGRPTVANPVGDIKTLFENNDVGILADFHPDDFSKKIIYLLENQEVSVRLGSKARKVATTVYDWKILIRKLENFYFDTLKEFEDKQIYVKRNG
ncbi:MAG: glycosyltransferase family 4 protein [Anaerolineales bacterium]|nr:glycosyltransferase family 4 protein [Anaerolineales bacterium]